MCVHICKILGTPLKLTYPEYLIKNTERPVTPTITCRTLAPDNTTPVLPSEDMSLHVVIFFFKLVQYISPPISQLSTLHFLCSLVSHNSTLTDYRHDLYNTPTPPPSSVLITCPIFRKPIWAIPLFQC